MPKCREERGALQQIVDRRADQGAARGRRSGAFNMPWSATQRWRRVLDRPITEAICAENNFDFFNYNVTPIPQADKPDF